MCGCQINDPGATYLAKGIATNTSITRLVLSRNHIGDIGVVELAKGIEQNHTLKHLDLSRNQRIGDLGACALGRAVRQNTTLIALILFDCSIDESGMKCLANAFRKSETLEILDTAENFTTKSFF